MAESLSAGATVADRYEIEKLIGTGGMAAVYRARHLFTNKVCALKMVHPDLVSRKEMVDLFLKEARVGSTLGSSPHIVEVFDAGLDPVLKAPFLAMELLQGETLQARLTRQGPLPALLARQLLSQLAEALEQAHSRRVIHRDLKSANLFLVQSPSGDPVLKVMDFGIAKVLQEEAQKTATHVGTPVCSAPEQMGATLRKLAARNGITVASDISPATDVWALGLIAYEMLTGLPASQYWGVETLADLPIKVVLEDHALATEQAGDRAALLPPGFDSWFARCLSKDAAGRWQSFAGAVRELSTLWDSPAPTQPEATIDQAIHTQLPVETFVATPPVKRKKRKAQSPKTEPTAKAETALQLQTFVPGLQAQEAQKAEPVEPSPVAETETDQQPREPATQPAAPLALDSPASETSLTSEETVPPQAKVNQRRRLVYIGLGLLGAAALFLGISFLRSFSARASCDAESTRTADLCDRACSWGNAKYCAMAGTILLDQEKPEDDRAVRLLRSACNADDPTGCARLGMLYEGGRAVQKDDAKAAECYNKACEGGDPDCCQRLATQYDSGRGVAKDEQRATTLLQKACDAKSITACKAVASRYEAGTGGPKDIAKAAQIYQTVCDLGATDSCLSLGVLLERGNGIPKDSARAAALYQKVCDGGNPRTCVSLGIMYDLGKDLPKNEELAGKLYEKACKLMSKFECYMLSDSLAALPNELRLRRRVALLQQSCDLGEPTACGVLSDLLADGPNKDLPRALDLMQKACDQKSGFRCGKLGSRYERGDGVKEDLKRAAALYAKACEYDEAWGCYAWGWSLAFGRGVDKDEKRAVEFFTKACDKKDLSGCGALGSMYYDGRGVTADRNKGIELMRNSCSNGSDWSCGLLQDRGLPRKAP